MSKAIGGLTHEEIVRLWTPSSHSEQFDEVVELAVDVTTELQQPFIQHIPIFDGGLAEG